MSATISSTEKHGFHPRSNASATLTAFLAIVSRDLLVTRREAITFLLQTLIQPLFFLFIFGKVLPTIGAANASFSTLLLPGVVALTVFLTAFQGPAIDLARDLGVIREIDDRLLAPLPIALVAVEKILLAALRGLIAGAFIFPLAFLILGSAYQVRTDLFVVLIGLMMLVALVGASFGLLLGTTVPIQLLPLGFARCNQVVSNCDAFQSADLRLRGDTLCYGPCSSRAGTANACDRLGGAGALWLFHPLLLRRHQALPQTRGKLICCLLVARQDKESEAIPEQGQTDCLP